MATLSQFLNGRVEDLRRLVVKAMKWDSDSIHDARVTTRRLKASIDLLAPVLSNERVRRFAKSLKRLRKVLGPLRDLDVMLVHLDQSMRQQSCSAGTAWLVRHLQQQRSEMRRQSLRKYPTEELLAELGCWWGLEQQVKDAEPAAQSLLKRAASGQLRAFTLSAERVVEAIDKEEGGGTEDVHSMRIAGKRLRYTLELAEPIGYPLAAPVIRSFKKLQDALGLWHDYVVLGSGALEAALQEDLVLKDSRVYGQVLELARLSHRKSDHYLAQFVKLWDQSGQRIIHEVQQTFRPRATPSAEQEPAAHDRPRELEMAAIGQEATTV